MDGWIDGWIDGRIDRWIDGWIDGWIDMMLLTYDSSYSVRCYLCISSI